MATPRSLRIKATYLFGDLLTLNMSIIIAALYKFGAIEDLRYEGYPYLVLAFNVFWVLGVIYLKAYDYERVTRISRRTWQLLAFIGGHAMILSGLWVLTKSYFYSREFFVACYLVLVVLMVSWRISFWYLLKIYRKSGFSYKKVIIFGYGEIANELEAFFRLHGEYGYKFNGYFDSNSDSKEIKGKFEEIPDYVRDNNIDEIYCCLPYVDYKDIKSLIDFGDEALIKVKLLTDFRGFANKRLELERYDHIPVLNVTAVPLDDWKNRVIKRVFDIVFSLSVMIFVFSWLFPIVALIIKLTSKGPVFFKQLRTGKINQSFACYKFRTMTVNTDSDSKQASKGDVRITPFGKFLRKSSIDELPQFINVLLGNMSVIGPRPHMLSHTEEYSKKIEKFMARHFVKPGITGLAQAKGYRGETTKLYQMKNRVKLDRFYIENWTLILDVKIIGLTAWSMIRGDENAF